MIERCTLPPPGWWCSRNPRHEGPCAARPSTEPLDPRYLAIIDQAIEDGMPRFREKLLEAVNLQMMEAVRIVKEYRSSTEKHLYCRIRYDNADLRCQLCKDADSLTGGVE